MCSSISLRSRIVRPSVNKCGRHTMLLVVAASTAVVFVLTFWFRVQWVRSDSYCMCEVYNGSVCYRMVRNPSPILQRIGVFRPIGWLVERNDVIGHVRFFSHDETSWSGVYDFESTEVALWPVPAALAVLVYVRLRRVRRQSGYCVCGYCLAGNVSGTCPECGAVTDSPKRQ